MTTQMIQTGYEVRPFRISFPEEALVALRRRTAQTRWPDKATVADQLKSARLIKGARDSYYPGAPHGITTTTRIRSMPTGPRSSGVSRDRHAHIRRA